MRDHIFDGSSFVWSVSKDLSLVAGRKIIFDLRKNCINASPDGAFLFSFTTRDPQLRDFRREPNPSEAFNLAPCTINWNQKWEQDSQHNLAMVSRIYPILSPLSDCDVSTLFACKQKSIPILIKVTPQESLNTVMFRVRRGIGLAELITNVLAR